MSVRNGTMTSGQSAFELPPPPMIGLLPATTVVYILLGLGALLPILLLSVVAVTLCIRRRTGNSSSTVTPVNVEVDGYHRHNVGFEVDMDDTGADDVFWGKTSSWSKQQYDWNGTKRTTTPVVDRGREYRKRLAELGDVKTAVHSSNNPNVYFRNRVAKTTDDSDHQVPAPETDIAAGVRRTGSHVTEEDDKRSSCRDCEDEMTTPSCDVTMTSSSSGDVVESGGSTFGSEGVATPNSVQFNLQQEEEQVLRLLDEINRNLETDLGRVGRTDVVLGADNVLQSAQMSPLVTHL